MIFGKTHDERRESLFNRPGRTWFAWHPVQLEDGKYIWLKRVRVEYSSDGYEMRDWVFSPLKRIYHEVW